MRFFRRGAHHQNGFRPTVTEIAAHIRRRAPLWRMEIIGGHEWLVGTMNLVGVPVGERAFLAVAPPAGIASLPALTEVEVIT